jgi:uroporphyrin-III C-methyltransferase
VTALPGGSVSLVGAGPGDPDLLTLKAVRALRRATVVLVDDLVSAEVLRYVKRTARVIHVGKRGGGLCTPKAPRAMAAPQRGAQTLGRPGGLPSTPQAFIERLMIAEARRGERVVRLKGGDPFVFGRGGEECDSLRAAGIEVEVINGITAGIAAPSAIGIPVTDRRFTQGVALVTGHGSAQEPDWAALARSGLTLVIYMGVARVEALVSALREGGLRGETPAAVICAAHTPQQRDALCTLDTLATTIARDELVSPAILVIGDVVQAASHWQAAPCLSGTHNAQSVPADRLAAAPARRSGRSPR